jgi:hypothetical protein
MSSSYTDNYTFSFTNAKYLASKIATDLKRIQRFYHDAPTVPSDIRISNFEEEVRELLRNGYLEKVTYGFKRNGNYIEPTLIYTAQELADNFNVVDDDPGKIRPNQNVTDATFHSFLCYSNKWFNLSSEEKTAFENSISITRATGNEPSINGYLVQDKTYSSGGKSLDRTSVKNY